MAILWLLPIIFILVFAIGFAIIIASWAMGTLPEQQRRREEERRKRGE